MINIRYTTINIADYRKCTRHNGKSNCHQTSTIASSGSSAVIVIPIKRCKASLLDGCVLLTEPRDTNDLLAGKLHSINTNPRYLGLT
jgi:hypothetical protein